MKLSDIFYDDAWICDPEKCPNCPKTICHDGFCYHTLDKNRRARGIKRFLFFLEFLIFGAPSWGPRYKWFNGVWTWKKGGKSEGCDREAGS